MHEYYYSRGLFWPMHCKCRLNYGPLYIWNGRFFWKIIISQIFLGSNPFQTILVLSCTKCNDFFDVSLRFQLFQCWGKDWLYQLVWYSLFSAGQYVKDHMICYDLNWPKIKLWVNYFVCSCALDHILKS